MDKPDTNIDTEKGMLILAKFLDKQISLLVEIEPLLRNHSNKLINALHPVYSSIIEDAISIRILGENTRLNQCYIISRAFLERLINYCYLQVCDESELNAYLSYSKNKAARNLSREIHAEGELKAKIEYGEGKYILPEDMEEAVKQFASTKGKEITRWTKVSLPDRANMVDKKAKRSALFMHLLTIYSDASEAIHGTIYGSLFHLGAFSPGSKPHDQASLDKHRYSTLSMLYLLTAGTIDTLISFLHHTGVDGLEEAEKMSNSSFREASKNVGLL